MILDLTTFVELRLVTDRRTNKRTDTWWQHLPR